ncbi:uncharacterized protein LOC115095888 isoform X3 [Rhinatrema bivittatum]|uniref:uncharacterized protein LOC115095888 isoform X3 n=1 Tax=Rhinatrema bivittatum TaxID=194408 RepID=UPI00112BA6A9|nr:uncharacterized protein LOC115095888 isoform X3 [Rhinatrema bivittatum]
MQGSLQAREKKGAAHFQAKAGRGRKKGCFFLEASTIGVRAKTSEFTSNVRGHVQAQRTGFQSRTAPLVPCGKAGEKASLITSSVGRRQGAQSKLPRGIQESSGFDLEQGMFREGKQVIEDRDFGDRGNFGGWPDWYGKESCRGMVPSLGPVGLYGSEGYRKGGQFPSRGGFEGRVRHEVSEGSLGRERGASFLAGPEEEVMPGTSRQEAWRDREFAGPMTGQDSGSSRRGGWHSASGQEKEVPVEAVARIQKASAWSKFGRGSVPGTPVATGPELRVRRGDQECAWVVGHSFVHWAHHRAERRPYGSNLYLEELQ